MKANSPASYRLSIFYHTPKRVGGRSSATPILDLRPSPLQLQTHIGTAKVFSRRFSGEDFAKRKARIYGVGEASAGDSVVPVVVDVVVEDSVVEAGLVASVVVGGLVAAGVAAGSVVSVFCSHAARSAALARMQMYFFIVLIGRGILL
jgi:hypothetical protein